MKTKKTAVYSAVFVFLKKVIKPKITIQITEPIAGTTVSLKKKREMKIKIKPPIAIGTKKDAPGRTNPSGSKSFDFRYFK